MRDWGSRPRQRNVCHLSTAFFLQITSIGPAPPRKRRRTRLSPPVVDQEALPRIDEVDLHLNEDIGKIASTVIDRTV